MDESELKKLNPELVEKLRQALTAGSDELFQLVTDPTPELLLVILKNPNLNEDHLLALLKRRDLTEELLKAVYRYEQKHPGHKLKIALVRNPVTPGPITLSLLPHFYLFELIDLCFLPGITPDQKIATERTIIQRLPEIELGNKMTLARRATSDVVGAMLKEGDPRLIAACLNNPRLKEVSVLQFLNSALAKADTISAVARHPKWQGRPNLRMAILKNRNSPNIWFTMFLPKLRTNDLNGLLISRRLKPQQKKLVQGELKKRGL